MEVALEMIANWVMCRGKKVAIWLRCWIAAQRPALRCASYGKRLTARSFRSFSPDCMQVMPSPPAELLQRNGRRVARCCEEQNKGDSSPRGVEEARQWQLATFVGGVTG